MAATAARERQQFTQAALQARDQFSDAAAQTSNSSARPPSAR